MSGDDTTADAPPEPPATPAARLRSQLLTRWRAFPESERGALDALLDGALERAAAAEAEVLTVMNPVSRPQRLRLAVIVGEGDLDSMYHNEWAELSVSHEGRCYLVYRRRDGGDYAVEWSPATMLPPTLMRRLPDPLATALLEGDVDGED